MFSYLRPHHHRRSPSTPTSPAEQSHQLELQISSDHSHPQRYHDRNLSEPPFSISPPPLLPPIPRVSARSPELDGPKSATGDNDFTTELWGSTRDATRSQDLYTPNDYPRLPFANVQRPESAGNAAPTSYAGTQSARPRTGVSQEGNSRMRLPEPSLPFVTAVDLQGNKSMQTGKRPAGAKLPSPPSGAPNTFTNFESAIQQPPRSGKTRLNLLNPMSLLARRRASQQAVQQAPPEIVTTSKAGKNFSENFDPRIRGTLVHDFSAPRERTRRIVSNNDISRVEENLGGVSRQFQRSPNPDVLSPDDATSPWSGGSHTPVFTENFEEEQYPAAGPHVRTTSDLTDLPLPKPPYAKNAQKSIEPKPTSEVYEASLTKFPVKETNTRVPVPDRPPPVPPKAAKRLEAEPRRVSIDPASIAQKQISTKKGRPRTVSEASVKDGIPKHMKSTSSRFSFDMIGAAEQERLLEDRHRQRALGKKANTQEDTAEDDFEDDFDYDNMDDDDGLEERIPGVNADFEEVEEEYEFPEPGGGLTGFTFQQPSLPTPMTPSSPGIVSTPRDANGEVIGFAVTKNSPRIPASYTEMTAPASPDFQLPNTTAAPAGLGLHGIELPEEHSHSDVQSLDRVVSASKEFSSPPTLDDDDLYFDDGIITAPGDNPSTAEFDESVFDNIDTDEYGRPVKSLFSLQSLNSPPNINTQLSAPAANLSVSDPKSPTDVPSSEFVPSNGSLAPQPSISRPQVPPQLVGVGLTQDSLATYQAALAAAAHVAAANGKFRRESVQSIPAISEQEDPQPGLITDSSQQTSHYEPFSPTYPLEDDFNYDDDLEDDLIIAAANAEALANDCDGFYGQEFGFYSAPAGTEAQFANGGYFGPRGVEGINRSQSGRVASREPNLTPITERSEYSNRNSFMNVPLHGSSQIISPGLAQLAEIMRDQEYHGDMSLDSLLKLRRGAWGGSEASIHSGTGSPKSAGGLEEGSPIGQLPPWSLASGVAPGGGHRRRHSGFSAVSEVASENASEPTSPTYLMNSSPVNNDKMKLDDLLAGDSKEKDKEMEKKERPKHRYTGSSESISYMKEDDPINGERWILERRRTGESGELEFLGREIVSGGRI